MAKRSMFVGMDVHKESIDISLAEDGRDGEVRRCPTRGYQQRQPSLKRGAADQTDLNNDEHGKSVLSFSRGASQSRRAPTAASGCWAAQSPSRRVA